MYWLVEDGHSNCIVIFDNLEQAIKYFYKSNTAKEIFAYNDNGVIGCMLRKGEKEHD